MRGRPDQVLVVTKDVLSAGSGSTSGESGSSGSGWGDDPTVTAPE